MSDMTADASRVDQKSGAERRMINRIAAYWEEIKGDRQFPAMTDIEPSRLEEVRSNCFVLDVSESVDQPVIRFIGEMLSENGTVARAGDGLASVPKRSLFGRIAEHYLECVANGAPIGIEAEYDNDQGETVFYRGVVVPFSDDGRNIDFVLGAINFKSGAAEASDSPQADDDDANFMPDATLSDAVTPESLEAEAAVLGAEATAPAPEEARPAGEASALLDALTRCRSLAQAANEAMARSRDALYTALAEAYAFRFEAEIMPDAYAELLAEAGIETQERAPYTPVVKLVFGADYDKTRISEYAAALAYGLRSDVPVRDFKAFLEAQEGGIKACVAAERAARRSERGESWNSITYARSILRAQPALGHLDNIEVEGDDEFVLILARREPHGNGVELVKVLHEKQSLVDGVLRRAAIGATTPAPDALEPDTDEPANENTPQPDEEAGVS